jgi:aminopeptidase N
MNSPVRGALARAVALLAILAVATPALAQDFDEAHDRHVVDVIQKAEARPLDRLALSKTAPDTSGWDATKYTIRLDINTSSRAVDGRVTVDGEATSDGLASVSLDFVGFSVRSVTVDGVAAAFDRVNNGRVLRVPLARALAAGESFSIEVSYAGIAQTENGLGLGFTANGAATFAEPEGARLWFPCKDRPSDKARYEGIITVPGNLKVASNGLLVDETATGNKRTFHWREDHQIATYLISLAIADYALIQDSYRGIPVWHYLYKQIESAGRRDFSRTPQMMEAFERRLGVPYPFDKYGHATFENFGGAMEHQSCSSYGAGLVTGDNRYDLVVAHELGHQWFGNLVSPAEWEEIWLNEGFASWTEFLWVEEWAPGSHAQLKASREANFMNYEESAGAYSLFAPPPGRLFGTTIYQKGAWVVSMLRYMLGDDAFFAGVRDYLETHSGKSARSTDLRASLEAASGQDLSAFFDEWVYGVGYPRYETAWQGRVVPGGRHQLDIRVRQMQRTPTVFTTPLEVEIRGANGERTRERIPVTSGDSFASLCLEFEPTAVTFDPDNAILGTISGGSASVPSQPALCGEAPAEVAVSGVVYKKSSLEVSGTGLVVGDSVVEVDGVELAKTKYPKRDRNPDGTTTRLVGKQKQLGRDVVPVGQTVQVTVLNRSTGVRSAPFAFTRQ